MPGQEISITYPVAGAPVNDFLPLRFRFSNHGVVEAGNELTGQICPVLRRQGQHFGDFFRSNAHALTVSGFLVAEASFGASIPMNVLEEVGSWD